MTTIEEEDPFDRLARLVNEVPREKLERAMRAIFHDTAVDDELDGLQTKEAMMSPKIDRVSDPPLSSVVTDAEIGDEFIASVPLFGHVWPEDPVGRFRLLKTFAVGAAAWRAEAVRRRDGAWHEAEKERRYQHLRNRTQALAEKVANLRRALRDYMAGQRVVIAEAAADLESKRPKNLPRTFQERLIQEKSELDGRLAKLEAYLSVFDGGVSPRASDDRLLLLEQKAAMTAYSETLSRRIAFWTE